MTISSDDDNGAGNTASPNLLESIKPQSFVGEIGVGRQDITPPLGIYSRCWGAAAFDVATEIHRNQVLSVLYFHSTEIHSDGSRPDPLLLITAGIPWMGDEEWRQYLEIAALASDLVGKPECIIMNVNHNHSSAAIEDIDSSLDGTELLDVYRGQFAEALRAAIANAMRTRCHAQLTTTMGFCDLAYNRDLKLEEGGPVYCGFNPHGDADKGLLVGRISALSDGKILATFVNYACHPTSLAWENTSLSPDYIGAMRDLVESVTDAPCCFIQGASGDVGPRLSHQGKTAVADKQGRQLGYAVLSTLEGMIDPGMQIDFGGTVVSGADLAFWKNAALEVDSGMNRLQADVITFPLSLKSDWPSVEEFEKLYQDCDDRVMKERYRRRLRNRRVLAENTCEDQAEVVTSNRLWRWQLGNVIFLSSPFELYSQFQSQLRSEFPGQTIMVANLCNGSGSYMVPADAYNETLYQKDVSPYAAGCLEKITEVARESIRSTQHITMKAR